MTGLSVGHNIPLTAGHYSRKTLQALGSLLSISYAKPRTSGAGRPLVMKGRPLIMKGSPYHEGKL